MREIGYASAPQQETEIQETEIQETESQGAESRYTAAEFDENYGLYYRFDRQGNVYEWSADPAGGTWMTQAQADESYQARAAQSRQEAPVREEALSLEETEPAVEAGLVEEVAREREDALRELLAEIRQEGIGQDEISDEEIAAMFDEAVLSELSG
jgi:hypothetical protein